MAATQVQFKIECERDQAILVMDKRQDRVVMDWQSARSLGDTIAAAVVHLIPHMKPVDNTTIKWELSQIKIAGHKGKVALLTAWTDRVKFTSLRALTMVGHALISMSRDMEIEERDAKIGYDETAFHNRLNEMKAGMSQRV